MTPLQLPYFRDPEILPAPIPSVKDIQASTQILKGAEPWSDRKVVVIGPYVVKYSRYNNQLEGENLLYVEQNLSISTPRLYAMWKDPDGILYLVMEYLQGDTLESLWSNIQESEKSAILSKLRVSFQTIRALPPPDSFGDVCGGHMPHHIFYSVGYDSKISGPFKNESQLVLGLISRSRVDAEHNKRHSYLADFFENALSRDLVNNDRTPTFTHSDLQRKNIMVREITSVDAQEKNYEVSIVDWELAGWYPDYWEYVAAFFAFKWDDDWPAKIGAVVDAWPAEAAMMRMIYQDLVL